MGLLVLNFLILTNGNFPKRKMDALPIDTSCSANDTARTQFTKQARAHTDVGVLTNFIHSFQFNCDGKFEIKLVNAIELIKFSIFDSSNQFLTKKQHNPLKGNVAFCKSK